MENSEIKIMVIGDFLTGKTNFIKRWTKDKFTDNYEPTIISDDEQKQIEIDGKTYNVHIKEFPRIDLNIINSYNNYFNGIIFLSDATLEDSIYYSLNKKNLLKEYDFLDEDILLSILIENKSDLLTEKNENLESEVKKFAKENGFIDGFLVSSKTGEKVNESIEFLIKEIIKLFKIKKKLNDNNNENDIDIHEIKFDDSEENENILKVILTQKEDDILCEYKSEINIDELKEKYKILKQIKNRNQLIETFEKVINKKRVKILLYLKKLVIQIGFIFINAIGKEQEITFELAYEDYENREDLEKKLIKEIINIQNREEEKEEDLKETIINISENDICKEGMLQVEDKSGNFKDIWMVITPKNIYIFKYKNNYKNPLDDIDVKDVKTAKTNQKYSSSYCFVRHII